MKKKIIICCLLMISMIGLSFSQQNNTQTANNNQTDVEDDLNFIMTDEDIDTLLFCSVFYQDFLEKKEVKIKEKAKELNVTDMQKVNMKVGAQILKYCFDNVNIDVVRQYFNNGSYFKEVIPEDYKQYENVSFDKFKAPKNLELSLYEKVLTYKLIKAYDVYNLKKEQEKKENKNNTNNKTDEVKDNIKDVKKDKKENKDDIKNDIKEEKIKKEDIKEDKINETDVKDDKEKKDNNEKKGYRKEMRIGKIDIQKIPSSIKIAIFVFIFGLFFIGISYLLTTLNKSKKEKEKEKKKKD